MARPKKVVDEKLLEALATSHLPDVYIAETLGISVWTLERRYAQKIKEFKSKGKAKLVMKAQTLAEKGNVPMLKYLLGNHLKWSERTTIETTDTSVPFTLAYTVDDLKKESDDQA